mgnify:CR=1 FL=1
MKPGSKAWAAYVPPAKRRKRGAQPGNFNALKRGGYSALEIAERRARTRRIHALCDEIDLFCVRIGFPKVPRRYTGNRLWVRLPKTGKFESTNNRNSLVKSKPAGRRAKVNCAKLDTES